MNYENKTVAELTQICKERNINGASKKKKSELIKMIQQNDKPLTQSGENSTNSNIQMSISEIVEEISIIKGSNYWYHKNKTDIPEYIKIIEIHKDDNDCYYTIMMRDKTEKQTIKKYLFNLNQPPLFGLMPNDERERVKKIFDYGFMKGILSERLVNKEWESGFNAGFDDGHAKGKKQWKV